jgi:hypothetical protein
MANKFLGRILLATLLPMSSHAGDVCKGVGPTEPVAHRELDQAAATALTQSDAIVRQVFTDGSWRILYATSSAADGAYVFYSGPSLRSKPVTVWAGAARSDETADITRWVKENAPGIPARLANCFSTYVTTRRTM